MGVIYTIACHDCKVKQDMDKWYTFFPVRDRDEALHYFKNGTCNFRHILAVSFLYNHNGHRIEVRTDADDEDFAYDYAEPVDYWTPSPEEKKQQTKE